MFVCVFVCLCFFCILYSCAQISPSIIHFAACSYNQIRDAILFCLNFITKQKTKQNEKQHHHHQLQNLVYSLVRFFMALPLHSTTPTMHPHGIILIRFYAALLLPPGPETRLVMCMLWQGIALSWGDKCNWLVTIAMLNNIALLDGSNWLKAYQYTAFIEY